MKTILSALAIAATLLSGAATANAADIPKPDTPLHKPVSIGDYLKTHPEAAPLTPDAFDPDEGEAIDPNEGLADTSDWTCYDDGVCMPVTEAATPEPQEDEPGWDCQTMGNKSCVPLAQTAITEDDARWDCYADGNRVCGPQEEGGEAEAWTTFDAGLLPQSIRDHGFNARYMGTMRMDAPFLTDSWHVYTVASNPTATFPGLYNVFAITVGN